MSLLVPLKKLCRKITRIRSAIFGPKLLYYSANYATKTDQKFTKAAENFEDIKLEGSWTMFLNRQDFLLC